MDNMGKVFTRPTSESEFFSLLLTTISLDSHSDVWNVTQRRATMMTMEEESQMKNVYTRET
jgi:hypothetical protein